MKTNNAPSFVPGPCSDAQDMHRKNPKTPSKDWSHCEHQSMQTYTRVRIFLTFLAASLWITSPAANASELIYSQYSDGQSVYGPSLVWPADAVNSEVADEFNVVANIDRVSAGGSPFGDRLIFRGYIFVSTNSARTTSRVRCNTSTFWRPAIQA